MFCRTDGYRSVHAARISSKGFASAFCAFSFLLLAGTGDGAAQEINLVTIAANDGSNNITGQLVSHNDEYYTVKSTIGTVQIAVATSHCIGKACPVFEKKANAREIVLKSLDNSSEIKGELISTDGEYFLIRTVLGEFRISAEKVECLGEACPEISVYDPKFAVHGTENEIRHLLPELFRSFAREKGFLYEAASYDGVPSLIRIRQISDNKLIAEISLTIAGPNEALQAVAGGDVELSVFSASPDDPVGIENRAEFDHLRKSVVATDGLVLIGHDDNPVRDLETAEIQRIWSGALRSWRPLGAGDFPITVHVVDSGSDQENAALARFIPLGAGTAGEMVKHPTEQDVIAAVRADRNAIGLVNRFSARLAHAKMLGHRKSCGLSAMPTDFGVKARDYPLVKPIYMLGKGSKMHPVAAEFIEWTNSAEAKQRVSDLGFVNSDLKRTKIRDMGVAVVHTAAVEPDFDGAEFSEMIRQLRNADRLSITFRFRRGSSFLDDESIRNVRELANRLRDREFDGQEVLLVGFSDSIGPAPKNSVLSVRRAEAVRQLLATEFDAEDLVNVKLTPMGFGEQMPLDCNDTDQGRANNRRVEVWVRIPGGV